jgi:hypothetical protein
MGRDHVQANYDLNEHLRRRAHAKLAQMKNMAGGSDKNRAAFFQNRGFTADHIRKAALLCALLAAAHRHVDHVDSIGATTGSNFSRGFRKDRAVNRHDRSRSRRMNHAMLPDNDLFRLGIVDDRYFYDIALFRNFPGRCDDPGAERSERLARFFAKIANRQLETRFGDVRGHGLSHRAETYKTNLSCHKFFP